MSRLVLIVEDARFDRDSVERIVAGAEQQAVFAESGAQALEIAARNKSDPILMDIEMPAMDGYAATHRLKANHAARRIPVLFVSGKHAKAGLAWSQMLGAKGHVAKPCTGERILDLLKF